MAAVRPGHYIVEARELMYLRSQPELQGDTFRPDFYRGLTLPAVTYAWGDADHRHAG